MVRIGEYSPNFRGNTPVHESPSRGIFGFGEYEEKRKYYNEQRKLEYQQYIAQQALNQPCSIDSKYKADIPENDKRIVADSTPADVSISSRREVATQTVNGEQRDASTNTVPDDHLPGNLKQNFLSELNVSTREKDLQYLHSAKVAYEQELHAQIEKKGHIRESRREQMEAELRERLLANEDRELERRGLEERRIKPSEDYMKQKLEGFHNCDKHLPRETNESRRMKVRNHREVASSVIASKDLESERKCGFSGNIMHHQALKSVPKACPFGSDDKLKMSRKQSNAQMKHIIPDPVVQELTKSTSIDTETPNPCCIREDDMCPSSKNYSDDNVLSRLGDVRRHLTMQQMKMEEMLKKNVS